MGIWDSLNSIVEDIGLIVLGFFFASALSYAFVVYLYTKDKDEDKLSKRE